LNIRDAVLSSLYSQLQASRQTLDDAGALKLLAAVADTPTRSYEKLLGDLSKPGMTRPQQVELAQKGMTASEKKDLVAILDQGTAAMTPTARAFLESVVGRTPPAGDPLKVSLTADQKKGFAGIAGPNVTIEAINLSTAPGARLRNEDTMVIAKSDAFGKFMGQMPDLKEGDVIRMRARDASGKVGDWLTVNASGLAATDTREAVVAVFRLGLSDAGGGKVRVSNINEGRQISEPGAKLQFTNTRTQEKTVAVVDAEGQLPKGLTLSGAPGDTFSVSATDGHTNTSFAAAAGTVSLAGGLAQGGGVQLPDPALHRDELDAAGKPKFGLKRFTGPLFKDGPSPADVAQGQLGDCYFPAALAALAQANPAAVSKMIKDNGDGSYTVTFKEREWTSLDEPSANFKDVQVKVDGDLYVRSSGGPLYGAAAGADKSEKSMELWFPLIEKAYAQYKGSYDTVGSGGRASDVFSVCLGAEPSTLRTDGMNPNIIWSSIKSAVDGKRPAAAGTFDESEAARYTNTGVYPDHAYSILGYEEKNGARYVTLRNPWGESEPAGNGANDGVFNLKLEDFMKLYQSFMTVGVEE
jgi:hypothetical protein